MTNNERLLADEPAWLHNTLVEAERSAQVAADAGRPEDAFSVILELYNTYVKAQPPGQRLHKGWMLHNLGMLSLATNDTSAARDWFMKAFVEDAVSRAEEEPDLFDELDRPAASNLLGLFRTPVSALVRETLRIHEGIARGARWRTPEEALEGTVPALDQHRAGRGSAPATEGGLESKVGEFADDAWRTIGDFGSRWEDRVFVGGGYGAS